MLDRWETSRKATDITLQYIKGIHWVGKSKNKNNIKKMIDCKHSVDRLGERRMIGDGYQRNK